MFLLPVLVGLLARQAWSPARKALLLFVLAGLKAVGEAFLAGQFGWTVVYAIAVNVVIGAAIHFSLYRPQTQNGKSVANWAASNGRQ